MVAVSIVLPCYNAAFFIAEAIGSVQAQTFQDWECVVVDDCSTDDSCAVVAAIADRDPRVILVRLTVNGGAATARNAGISHSRGDWITLLDADDLYAPDRVARLVALAQGNGQAVDMVVDNQVIAEFPAASGNSAAFKWLTKDVQPFDAREFFRRSTGAGRSLNPGYMKPLFARTFIETHELRYDPRFRSGQDYLFYADAFAKDPRCVGTRYCGYIYRRRSGSLSRSGGQHLLNQARLSDEILARHGAALSPSVHSALGKRRRYLLNSAALSEFRIALADRRWSLAARIAVTKPQLVLGVAQAVRKRATGIH